MDWAPWQRMCLEQHAEGQLDPGLLLPSPVRPRASVDALTLSPGSPRGDPPPKTEEPSSILTDDHLLCLAPALPQRTFACSWQLLYATHRDGISLHSLYRKAAGQAPTVLIVK